MRARMSSLSLPDDSHQTPVADGQSLLTDVCEKNDGYTLPKRLELVRGHRQAVQYLLLVVGKLLARASALGKNAAQKLFVQTKRAAKRRMRADRTRGGQSFPVESTRTWPSSRMLLTACSVR